MGIFRLTPVASRGRPMSDTPESSFTTEPNSETRNHTAQFGNSGAGDRRLLKSKFPRPRAEGPDGGAAKPGDARRMQTYLIRRTPPQSRGPGKGGMKARKNFQQEKFFVFSLADVPGGVLVTLPPRAK